MSEPLVFGDATGNTLILDNALYTANGLDMKPDAAVRIGGEEIVKVPFLSHLITSSRLTEVGTLTHLEVDGDINHVSGRFYTPSAEIGQLYVPGNIGVSGAVRGSTLGAAGNGVEWSLTPLITDEGQPAAKYQTSHNLHRFNGTVQAEDVFVSSNGVDIGAGAAYRIGGEEVLKPPFLSSAITSSRLEEVGTLKHLEVSGDLQCAGSISGVLTTSEQPNITRIGALSDLTLAASFKKTYTPTLGRPSRVTLSSASGSYIDLGAIKIVYGNVRCSWNDILTSQSDKCDISLPEGFLTTVDTFQLTIQSTKGTAFQNVHGDGVTTSKVSFFVSRSHPPRQTNEGVRVGFLIIGS